MARNRKIFEDAMRAGANAAWDKNWKQAILDYQRALSEFPNDVAALTNLGLAYSNAGQLEAALGIWQRANERTPDDPVLHERIGKTLEQLGQGKEAAESYLASAERYLNQKQTAHLALERWHDAIRVWPDCLQAHAKLLQYYQGQGQVREAVEECLTLARIYGDQGQNDYAIQICEHALKLTPHDAQVLATLDKLRYGEQITVEPTTAEISQEGLDLFGVSPQYLESAEGTIGSSILNFQIVPEKESIEDRGSPIEITRQKALSDLAESFFEEEVKTSPDVTPRLSKAETDALLGRAIDFQTRGKIEEAIDAYEQVIEAGVEQVAMHFNLGLLYQEKLRFDEAISQFEHAVYHPEYTLGSHFALGECYRGRGRIDEALEHFVEVLKIVDLATVQRDQADDLIQLYESLADSYIAKGEREQALEFTNSLVELLSEKGWEDKVVQARRRLDELAQEGPTLSLAEMLAVPGSEHILESVALAQEYAKRGMFYAALEECYYALDRAPVYLPIHRQMAQVLVAMGKVDEAVSKLVVIADAYQMRGNVRPAMAVYQHALRLAPMDTAVRAKLIDLLISHGEIDKSLEHYLILADSYYHLAQMDRAREIYQEALRIAPRGTPENRWDVRILHKIGDIDMQHVDWKRAIEAYEQIRKLAPDDERARLTLMDLYYRFNQPESAITELDSLLKIYQKNNKTQRIFAILEDAVNERPDNIPLRTRMAQLHLDAGNVEQALIHLDKLGDLQMEAGRTKDARATIQVIVALNPPNVAAYQQLLDQL
ncbi:MAG: tetratricopeptide repeat protein [Chloroflexota bacterium]|nr:tetratricopeptide repeat protein [Chloroflexota bacterium]